MKNYLYSLIAVAALLFATACSESEQASDAEQVARVTFTLRLNDGVDTRAIYKPQITLCMNSKQIVPFKGFLNKNKL